MADELDQVDAADRTRRIVGEEGPHALPDDVLARQAQDLGIDRLDRGGPEGHQGAGVAQRRVEAVVAQVDQHAVAWDRQDLERGFGHDAERAFGAADHAVEVEAALPVADMGEVVAGEAAVELGEASRDGFAVLPRDPVDHAVDLAHEVFALPDGAERVIVEGVRGPDRAVAEHGRERPHVVARLAVEAGTLAAGVGRDHAADRGAVRGAEFWGEEQAVRPQRGIELILDDAGLDPHAAVRDIDLEDAVHVAGEVDHDARGERLAVGPGAAAARRDDHRAEAFFGEQSHDAGDIFGAAREQDRLRRHTVDRVVGREDHPVCVLGRDAAREPGLGKRVEKPGYGHVRRRSFGKSRDHDGPEPCRWPAVCRPRHVNARPASSGSEADPRRRASSR